MTEATPAHDFTLWAIGALTAGIAALAARTFAQGAKIAALEVRVEAVSRLEEKVDGIAKCVNDLRIYLARALNGGRGEDPRT